MYALKGIWAKNKKEYAKRPWTTKDLRDLKELYPAADLDHLAKKLDRSKAAIYAKAMEQGISRLRITDADTIRKFIIDNYKTMSAKDIGAKFGLSGQAVHGRARRMGIRKDSVLSKADRRKPNKRKWWEAPKKRNK